MTMYLYYIPLIAAISLGGWILLQKNKGLSRAMAAVFYLAAASYIGMLFIQDWSTASKLLTFSRDTIFLSIFSAIIMASRRIKILPFIILLTMGLNYTTISNYFKTNTPVQLTPKKKTAPDSNQKPSSTKAKAQTEFNDKDLDTNAELLVQLEKKSDLRKLDALAKEYDLVIKRAFYPMSERNTSLDEYYTIDLSNNRIDELEDLIDDLRDISVVEWFETNEMLELEAKPANPIVKKHSCNHVNDPMDAEQWMHEALEMDKYYGLLETLKMSTKKRAKLFILDSGVDANHEDLKANYKSLNKSYDTDGNGHGSHCAGIAAAVSNNGKGIASFSIGKDFVELTGIKVMSSLGFGSQKMIIDGIIEAADNGADVISLSLGGISNQAREKAYNDAMAYANSKGAIVVVAAGNSNYDASKYSPANSQGVIAVSAVDETLAKASFSNTTENITFAVTAPGVNIMSTLPDNKYKALSGTSMATPHVAGLLAVMKSLQPKLTHEQAFDILEKSGKQTDDYTYLGSLIQPYKAVKLTVQDLLN